MKTLKKVFKQDKEQFNIPKNVQDAIPVKTIWSDGIFLVGKNKYSKCYKFSDINYRIKVYGQRVPRYVFAAKYPLA